MEIRPTHPQDDFHAIADIYVQSWQKGYKGIVPQDYLDSLSPFHWENLLKNGPLQSLVAVEKDCYVATASVSKNRDEKMEGWGEIVSFYVLPDHWKKGIGSELMTAVKKTLLVTGFPRMYLWVLKDNHRARSFYEKNGFTLNGAEMSITIQEKILQEVRYDAYTKE